jgi:hypothetical protein
MKFHFEFDIKKAPQPVRHQQKLLLVGSCFTENIGEKLRKHKFNILENPNGILFNPVSVAEAVETYITNTSVTEKIFSSTTKPGIAGNTTAVFQELPQRNA